MLVPDLDHVARRAQCVLALLMRAQIEDALRAAPERAPSWVRPLEKLESWLLHERLDGHLSKEESSLLRAKWGEWSGEDSSASAWRLEGLAVLVYALGRKTPVPPLHQAAESEEVLAAMPFLGTLGDVLAGARLCAAESLDQTRRKVAVWRWRAKTELLHRGGVAPSSGEPFSAMVERAAGNAEKAGMTTVLRGDFDVGGRPYASLSDGEVRTLASVAVERSRAVDWVCGRGSWDAPLEL
ncbi:MAG: hypothetical protein ACO3JL_01760 [Myxococcota bacterium]